MAKQDKRHKREAQLLIGYFMGLKHDKRGIVTVSPKGIPGDINGLCVGGWLQYYKKYDWLMPVLEELSNSFDTFRFTIGNKDTTSRVTVVYDGKSYNLNSSQGKWIDSLFWIVYKSVELYYKLNGYEKEEIGVQATTADFWEFKENQLLCG